MGKKRTKRRPPKNKKTSKPKLVNSRVPKVNTLKRLSTKLLKVFLWFIPIVISLGVAWFSLSPQIEVSVGEHFEKKNPFSIPFKVRLRLNSFLN